jgi:3-deoxy-D-manno-octulosonate 8-phosphate phosphatase (KDO 8-P phosphatase)
MPASRISPDEFARRAREIRLLALDVDGVLTDGSIVYSERGEEIKRFHVRDGFAVASWRRLGRPVAAISGRTSRTTALRCRELGISPVIQSSPRKGPAFREVLKATGRSAEECCFVGDDLPDLPLILAAGLGVAVADADPSVLRRAPWTTQAAGGRGAVREIVEQILAAQGLWQEVVDHYAQAASTQ